MKIDLYKLRSIDIEISNSGQKNQEIYTSIKRQDKPDSALMVNKKPQMLKDYSNSKLIGITKNSVSAIRNKSYWNYNNLNPKDPVALNFFLKKIS